MFDLNATPTDERETVIIIRDHKATIYSCDFRKVNQFDKLYEAVKEDRYGKTYTVSENCVRFRKENTGHKMSDQKKKEAAERLIAAREKKKAKAKEKENG